MVIYRLGLPYYKEFDNFQFAGLRGGVCITAALASPSGGSCHRR